MPEFRQITIVGVGLIGGSFALAARRAGFQGRIVGCDNDVVLEKARAAGAIDTGHFRPEEAIKGSELVLLSAPVGAIIDCLERVGPRPVTMDVDHHDRLCAWVSHLPQMISTAYAGILQDEFGSSDQITRVGGRALAEMTRIAASPYSMWRDIALTNTENIQEALLRLEQRLAHIRENLRGAALRDEFERANKFTGPNREKD